MTREIETDLVFLNNQYWVAPCENDADIIGVTDIDNKFIYAFPRHYFGNGMVKPLFDNYSYDDNIDAQIDEMEDWLRANHPEYL